MFNPTAVVIDAFVEQLEIAYTRNYGNMQSSNSSIIVWAGRMALEHFTNSDALYHNMEHTMMVALVGQEILRGKHIRDGGVASRDWVNYMISLLCHDIGHIRGICHADDEQKNLYATGIENEQFELKPWTTDACLTPYHVDRSKLFIRERFGKNAYIDADFIANNIEMTRFPLPKDAAEYPSDDYSGLVRAAALIGHMADPDCLRKLPALFYEMQETGLAEDLGFHSLEELRRNYPRYYWAHVSDYIQPALRYLKVTQEGKQWVSSLYSHIFYTEHGRF